MVNHDHSYKLLFAHPCMVRDLLESFVGGAWLADLDFSTLVRVSDNYVSDDLRSRADDIVWRVRCGDRLIYLLLEFQSRADPFMAVRVLTYVALLYQDLIRSKRDSSAGDLPAILPIVLHSGASQWHAAEDMESLLSDSPPGLENYRPQLRYVLIDECRYDDSELARRGDLASMLFRLENCRMPHRLPDLVGALMERLQGVDQKSLRRAFGVWLERVVLARLADETQGVTESLLEKPTMLSERFDEWEKEFKLQGAAAVVTRQIQKRFGDVPESVRATVNSARADQIDRWAERLLDVASIEELFADRRGPAAP
jgi:hypothetical protein